MKNLYKLFLVMLAVAFVQSASAQLDGTWKMAPEAGAMGVGPAQGDISWWSNSVGDLELRACFFDDEYVLGTDGSFSNVLQDETWIEAWQGGTDACGTPVAPHDGSATATYVYDDVAGTFTVNGVGAYMGIPKAVNGMELSNPADAPESVTYIIDMVNDSRIILDIETGTGVWWRFVMVKDGGTTPTGEFTGEWTMTHEAGAMGVGPGQGDMSWWSNSVDDLTLRACFFDDKYVFGEDGSFSNVLQDETWIEAWQGGADACGTPVAPHDGSATATFEYDEEAGTVTINGVGAYLGIPKAVNGMELSNPADAPESVTYLVNFMDEDNFVLDIETGTGVWWRFKLSRLQTGVSEISNETVSIYPNPAQDYIFVSENYQSLSIFNVNGSQVLFVQDNQTQIDVSNLSSGVYFIQMNTLEGNLKQSKFIKK